METPLKNWEEEFEKLNAECSKPNGGLYYPHRQLCFIRSLLLTAKKEAREEVVEEIKDWTKKEAWYLHDGKKTKVIFLEDLLNKLK
jgi:hypothetical protein